MGDLAGGAKRGGASPPQPGRARGTCRQCWTRQLQPALCRASAGHRLFFSPSSVLNWCLKEGAESGRSGLQTVVTTHRSPGRVLLGGRPATRVTGSCLSSCWRAVNRDRARLPQLSQAPLGRRLHVRRHYGHHRALPRALPWDKHDAPTGRGAARCHLPCGRASPRVCCYCRAPPQPQPRCPGAHRDCHRLPWFQTRPKEGSQPSPV